MNVRAQGPVKTRILVVDDEQAIRELLRLHLRNEGYEVVEAPDAIVAAKMLLARAWNIDLLIVDASMPYMTGIDLAAAVIGDTTLPPVRIILITGHEDFARRADRLDVPCLMKPFTASTLLSIVDRSLAVPLKSAPAGLREKRMSSLSAYERRQRRA